MDGLANYEDLPMEFYEQFLIDDPSSQNNTILDNSGFGHGTLGDEAPCPSHTSQYEELLFDPVIQAMSFYGDISESQPSVTNSDEDLHPSPGLMGDQGGTPSLSAQPPSLLDCPESSNSYMSPILLQFDLSLMSSSPEHMAAIEQHGTTGGCPRLFREIRPRPPGQVATNIDNGQPSPRECKRKLRENKRTCTSTPRSDKSQPRGRGAKSYTCERCRVEFTTSKKLTRHYGVRHKKWAKVTKGIKVEFPCLVSGCTKEYTRKDNLKRHQRDKHSWLK